MTASAAQFRRRRLGTLLVVTAVVVGALVFYPSAPAHLLDRITGKRELFAGRQLVYGRHALTPPQVSALAAASGGHVTAVEGGELAVQGSQPDFPDIPVQAFTVDPASYAAAAGRSSLADELRRGAVLSATESRLRQLQTGDQLRLADGRSLVISAVVDDHLLGGYEVGTSRQALGHAMNPDASYVLLPAGVPADRLRKALPGLDLRIERHTINGYLSSADSVLTQADIKVRFGEFATTTGTGTLRLDPLWRQNWIVSTALPQLGVITCNRLVIPPLRAAMVEITRRGLGALVHTADFQREGGCWNPRVERFGAGKLSAHAWGIAVDINVDVNPLGAVPRQDPRLVAVMAAHGFTWGGLFLRPDGAHFEWTGRHG